MTHPTGDAQRAREEAPDLAALSETASDRMRRAVQARDREEALGLPHMSAIASPGKWEASCQPGDRPQSYRLRDVNVILHQEMCWQDAEYVAALVNAHRSGALLDLRSEAGRGLTLLARYACESLFGSDMEAQTLEAAMMDDNLDPVPIIAAALALLDAMEETDDGR